MKLYTYKGWYRLIGLLAVSMTAMPGYAQTETTYMDGPVYIDAGSNTQWYGPVEFGPNARVYIVDGEKTYLYGSSIKLNTGAQVSGANSTWTVTSQGSGTGSVVFKQPNPISSTTVQQTLNGGNSGNPANSSQNTFTSIEIDNTSGVSLNSSDTRIGTSLLMTNGNLLLGTNNLVLSSAGNISGAAATKFIVTASSGHLVKENFNTGFLFPVGVAAGDYTPALITPAASNTVLVNVSTASSSPATVLANNGVQRVWNIYGNNTSGATISLQHNTATNQSNFQTSSNFVTRYGTKPNNTGDNNSLSAWQSNTPGASTASSGTESRSRVYSALATSATANEAYYSKSSNTIAPLPVKLEWFTAETEGCMARLSWKAASETGLDHYTLQTSADGSRFKTARVVAPERISGYVYQVSLPQETGDMFYRLAMRDADGTETLSNTLKVHTGCGDAAISWQLHPNPVPTGGTVRLQISAHADKEDMRLVLTDMLGRKVWFRRLEVQEGTGNYLLPVDLPAGTYAASLLTGNNIPVGTTQKISVY